jgi:uncharacterized repeat protein (TIGR04076 family)
MHGTHRQPTDRSVPRYGAHAGQEDCSMKRRVFVAMAGAAPGLALARTEGAAGGKDRYEPNERYKCRITVLRKDFYPEFWRQSQYGQPSACGRFEVGQQFVTENPWDPPPGFCQWAWADLRSIIHRIHAGNRTTMIACCTDGLRPVFFKMEAAEI